MSSWYKILHYSEYMDTIFKDLMSFTGMYANLIRPKNLIMVANVEVQKISAQTHENLLNL